MIELPEARTLARQLGETITGKTIERAVANASPHGFAFYTGDPAAYGALLKGKRVRGTDAHGGRAGILADDMRVSLNDGVNARYYAPGVKRPDKHQLLIEFDDDSAIVCTVSMYGGMSLFTEGSEHGFYFRVAEEKPSPLDDAFDMAYFASLRTPDAEKLSAKAFLATEQRIPGLGNGVLQDILWHAKISPKKKMSALSDAEFERMFAEVKRLLALMTHLNGRDTEKDLFGAPGGYATIMSRKNNGMPCPACGGLIERKAYLGGNVYVCGGCQPE